MGLLDHQSEEVDILGGNIWQDTKRCRTCMGTGTFRWWTYEAVEHSDFDSNPIGEYECPCIDQLCLHRFLLYRGIDLQYQRASFRDFRSVELRDIALKYIEEMDDNIHYGSGMLLTGTHGTGKSMIAAMVAKALIAQQKDVYFITFNNMVSIYIQAKFSKERRDAMKSRFQGVELLVIDDIGQEEKQNFQELVTGQARAILDEVLRARQGLCTFVTTNLPVGKIVEHYGTNVGSLLSQFDRQELYAEDFRKKLTARSDEERSLKLHRPVVWGCP